jgi:hypothetical protein
MYICNRYQIILSILWPLNMLVYLIKIPYNIIIKYVIKINNMYDLWEFYPWLNTYIENRCFLPSLVPFGPVVSEE